MAQPATGLEFPCRYPVKVMAVAGPQIRDQVLAIVSAYGEFSKAEDVRCRPSRTGRFESITVTVQIESRERLEELYAALGRLDAVKMML